MAKANYQVKVITEATELDNWTAGQYSSFVGTGNVLHDVFFPPASPPSPAELKAGTDRHKAAFEDDHEHNVWIQINDPETGNIMGGAKWQFWPHDPKRPVVVPVSWIDTSTEEGQAEQQFAQKAMDEFMGRRSTDMACPHGLLDLCYTVPQYERKGVASALVSWGLERVDQEGWVAFTEASPRGGPVYERLGFEKKEVVRLRYDELGDYAKAQGDVVWTFMVRPAKKQ